jgi:hypothetical protein
LFMVSHVNSNGETRGSKNIYNVADLAIRLDRNPSAESAVERNKTYLTVNKNRFASMTGPAGVLSFDPKTFIVKENPQTGFPPLEAQNDNQLHGLGVHTA